MAQNIDRLHNIAGQITEVVELTLQISKHHKTQMFLVLELKENIILGID